MKKTILKVESADFVKEMIFSNNEVAVNYTEKMLKNKQISRAKIKGSLAKIVFEDLVGLRELESKIIDSTPNYIFLNKDVRLPKRCIHSVSLA